MQMDAAGAVSEIDEGLQSGYNAIATTSIRGARGPIILGYAEESADDDDHGDDDDDDDVGALR